MKASNLRYVISLEPAKEGTVRVIFHFIERMTNNSGKKLPLFADGIVTKGKTDVPLELIGTTTPKGEIVSFGDLTVDGISMPYTNDSRYLGSSKIDSCVRCNEIADPGKSYEISYTQKYLENENDYFSRKIRNQSKGAIVTVHKPSNFIITINWFGLSHTRVLENSLTTYSEEVMETLMPGNGFQVYWQKVERPLRPTKLLEDIKDTTEENRELLYGLSMDVVTKEDLMQTERLLVHNQESLQRILKHDMTDLKDAISVEIENKIGEKRASRFWKIMEKLSTVSDVVQFAEYVKELVFFLNEHKILQTILPFLLKMILG